MINIRPSKKDAVLLFEPIDRQRTSSRVRPLEGSWWSFLVDWWWTLPCGTSSCPYWPVGTLRQWLAQLDYRSNRSCRGKTKTPGAVVFRERWRLCSHSSRPLDLLELQLHMRRFRIEIFITNSTIGFICNTLYLLFGVFLPEGENNAWKLSRKHDFVQIIFSILCVFLKIPHLYEIERVFYKNIYFYLLYV